MKRINTRFITMTGMLLALTIVFQVIGRFFITPLMGPNNNFVVGPLVNACLLIATASVGLLGGTIIAILAPFGALITGAGVPPLFVPFIAIGNFLIVFCFHLLKRNRIAGLIVGSIIKFAFLFAAINVFVSLMELPTKKANLFVFAFGWPQLVTAIIGGIIAIAVLKSLDKSFQNNENI